MHKVGIGVAQSSLKLVESADIQICRAAEFGEMMKVPGGSSKVKCKAAPRSSTSNPPLPLLRKERVSIAPWLVRRASGKLFRPYRDHTAHTFVSWLLLPHAPPAMSACMLRGRNHATPRNSIRADFDQGIFIQLCLTGVHLRRCCIIG